MMTTLQSARTVYDSNLTTDAPHFAPPTTPSRSPFKDTLHRRSPTKQLRPGGRPTINYDEYRRLANSEASTAAEKELAARVVHAAEKLKDWCKEIEQWGWSGSFDKRHGSVDVDPFQNVELSASLSPDEVEAYDVRLDEIDNELQELEVDDLKEQILGIHLGRSRPSSSYSSASVSNLVLYDDFQLFVTESLLHSLPYHAKLKHYLKLWHVRLDAFREAPSFLSGLLFLEEILREAWQGMRHSVTPEVDSKEINDLEEQLMIAQSALKHKVSELGSQLDRMLDILEGQDDCLPDIWIDKYENNEKSYAEWSYQADRKLFHIRHLEREPAKKALVPQPPAALEISHSAGTTDIHKEKEEEEEEEVETHIQTEPLMTDFEASMPPSPTQAIEHVTTEEVKNDPFPPLSKAEENVGPAENSDQEEAIIAEVVHRPVEAILRRASVASIESFTRDQVKSVDVPSRRNSATSFSSYKRPVSRSFESSVTSSPNEAAPRRSSKPTSPLAVEPAVEWPTIQSQAETSRPQTPVNVLPKIQRSSVSSVASSATDDSDQLEPGEESPSVRASMNHTSKPPLNFAMKKRRSIHSAAESRLISGPFPDQDLALDTTLPTIPASPTKVKSPVSPSMPLEEQISNILQSLPARIKLKSSSTPNAPEIKPKHKRKTSTSSVVSTTSDAPRPGIRSRAATPSLSARPTITLAPADDQGPRRGANDPEIKVYHLMSGNDKPLKLFVRRVGENGERVMVRVGGGWADLAEYLKTYAEHHGHRAVSDGKVEVLGLGNDRVVTPSPSTGGRNSSLGFRSDSRMESGRSESRLGFRSDSRQGMRGAESHRDSLTSSIGYPSIGPSGNNPSSSSPATAVNTPVVGDEENPTPISSNGSSQKKGSSFWDDGGLMGPAAMKKGSEISSEKKEWVDSVVEQAKKVGRKVEFGDLGKKGGTRRVFLKGRVASGTAAPASAEKE